MPRPIKDPAAKRTERTFVRYTPAEIMQLDQIAAAAGMSVSDWTRHRTINAEPTRQQATPDQAALIKAVGQLGNIRADINQLVKDRQAHHYVKPEHVEAALQALVSLSDRLHAELDSDGH